MKEAELRDLLCENLSVLEEGLVLLKKEQYIPNHLGTRSFIDIYAKDKHNHHVLIEVKRSNEAAREAINEVIKYVEGVKIHLGARDDEIRVIIASTKWDELLVPYSRFVNETNISIVGLHLYIAEKKIISEKISVLNFNKGRFIAPWYDVYWYKNQNSLYHGIDTIKKDLISKNILDFIITIFKATTPIPSPSKERRIKIIQSFSGAIKSVPQELFDYIAIVSIQAKTTKEYISIIQSKDHSREELDDIFSLTEDMDKDEQLAYLHENAMESHDIDYDDFEIGYPAKVLAMMNNHN
ncbi:endonuclease NucS domain-containing protein, partial [Enterobacter hormaechei]